MIRTTIALPEPLYHHLIVTAKAERTSVAALVRELLSKTLITREEKQLDRVYQGLAQLQGIGSQDITDASTTINELLYGHQGAWRADGKQVPGAR